jgi:Family of unknown function (DUF5947)
MNDDPDRTGSALLADAVAARRRAGVVSGLRGLARASPGPPRPPAPRTPAPGTPAPGTAASPAAGEADTEVCDLCGIGIADDHRHLLMLTERRIVCSCETCWAMRSGDGDYRPTGNRTLWLPGLDVPDDLWASFQIPIGLAFFMESTVTACVVAMYPSPAGATESELHFDSWSRMTARNPVLAHLEPDIEGLIANRLSDPPMYVIAPIDRCYALTGMIKAHWEGISGGAGVDAAVARFFEQLRAEAASP